MMETVIPSQKESYVLPVRASILASGLVKVMPITQPKHMAIARNSIRKNLSPLMRVPRMLAQKGERLLRITARYMGRRVMAHMYKIKLMVAMRERAMTIGYLPSGTSFIGCFLYPNKNGIINRQINAPLNI